MYRLDRDEFLKPKFVSLWSTLAFQAGYLNALGFLACGRYVTHVTGVGTQLGIGLANQKAFFVLELAGFPLSFILGSFFSGVFTIARIEREKKPLFEIVTFALPIGLFILMLSGMAGSFGLFGEELLLPRDFALLYSLSFVAGMQNGCFATLTKGQIRTTHLTGISTDIGTDFARLLFGKISGKERELTRLTNLSRIFTFISFTVGSILSVLVSRHLEYGSLIIPMLTSIGVAVTVKGVGTEMDRKYGMNLIPNQSPSQSRGT
jgi:uncharacterized membrane protein YoaK (UPF0700 family)